MWAAYGPSGSLRNLASCLSEAGECRMWWISNAWFRVGDRDVIAGLYSFQSRAVDRSGQRYAVTRDQSQRVLCHDKVPRRGLLARVVWNPGIASGLSVN